MLRRTLAVRRYVSAAIAKMGSRAAFGQEHIYAGTTAQQTLVANKGSKYENK